MKKQSSIFRTVIGFETHNTSLLQSQGFDLPLLQVKIQMAKTILLWLGPLPPNDAQSHCWLHQELSGTSLTLKVCPSPMGFINVFPLEPFSPRCFQPLRPRGSQIKCGIFGDCEGAKHQNCANVSFSHSLTQKKAPASVLFPIGNYTWGSQWVLQSNVMYDAGHGNCDVN